MSKCQTPPMPTERIEQITLFQWAALNVGKMPELVLLHHIPNGGHRSKATAGRLRAEGVKSGVPDLCLPVSRGGFHGLYIEMKRERGNMPTAHQKEWIAALERQGYKAVVCHGWEAAAQTIIDYLRR